MEKYKAKCELRAFPHLTHSPDCETRCSTALMWKWPRNEPVVARGGLYKVPMIGKRYSLVQCSPPGTSRRSVLIWRRRPAASSFFEQSNWVVVTLVISAIKPLEVFYRGSTLRASLFVKRAPPVCCSALTATQIRRQ